MTQILVLMGIFPVLLLMIFDQVNGEINKQAKLQAASQRAYNDSAFAELAKAHIKSSIKQSGISTLDLGKALHDKLVASAVDPIDTAMTSTSWAAARALATNMTQWHAVNPGNPDVQLRVVGVSSLEAPNSFIDAEVCRKQPPAAPGTPPQPPEVLRMRFHMGTKSPLANAVTSNPLDCVFCHASIYGNVAEYGNGTLAGGHDNFVQGRWLASGPPSVGSVSASNYFKLTDAGGASFAASSTKAYLPGGIPGFIVGVDPDTSPFALGRGIFVHDWRSNYNGREISWFPQRQEQVFPKLDPYSMRSLASGSLRGDLKVVPLGGSYSAATSRSSVQGMVDGNLIINGRDGSPFELSGTVIATGDVIVFGSFRGKGSILAGRNIYVADDLKAISLPPIFNGSQASNQQLAQVGYKPQARSLANLYWSDSYDQLFLGATNNVVLGDPWPVDFPASPMTISGEPVYRVRLQDDLRYISKVSLSRFAADLAYEASTGMMSDRYIAPNGTPYKILPWDSVESLSTVGSRVFVDTPLLPAVPPGDTKTDRLNSHHANITRAYTDNFLPKNVVDSSTGAVASWIDNAQFRSLTRNGAQYAAGTARDACGKSSKHLWDLQVPNVDASVPGDISTYSAADLFPASLTQAVDMGAFDVTLSEFIENPATNGGLRFTSRQLMQERFAAMCVNAAQGRPLVGAAELAASVPGGLQNPQYTQITPFDASHCGSQLSQRVEEYIPGSPTSPPPYGVWCWLGVKDRSPEGACSAGVTPKDVRIIIRQRTDTTGNTSNFCDTAAGPVSCLRKLTRVPYKQFSGCNTGCKTMGSCYDAITGTTSPCCVQNCDPSPGVCDCGPVCTDAGTFTYKWEDSDYMVNHNSLWYNPSDPAKRGGSDYGSNPDFGMLIESYGGSSTALQKVTTRYWKSSMDNEVVRNKIRQVDAFLFANQFVSYVGSTQSDRTVVINGGIVAKDLIGRYVSKAGYDRDPSYFASGYPVVNGYWGAGQVDLGMVVRYDPRHYYSIEFIYNDFGKIEMISKSDSPTCGI